jgi:hypothetical protein
MTFTMRQALFATVLSSTLIPLASAHAQIASADYPDLPYPDAPYGYRYPLLVGAGIGFRRSLDAGERSALKWLSRLIKENPKARTYVVRWHTVLNGTTISVLTDYNLYARQLTQWQVLSSPPPESYVTTHQKVWRPVLIQELHAIAKRNGTTAGLRLSK